MKRTVLYYTVRGKPESILKPVRERLLSQCARLKMDSVAVSTEVEWGFGISMALESCGMPEDIFRRILRGLVYVDSTSWVFLCEDDVLYHDSYFTIPPAEKMAYMMMKPEETLNYNLNVVHLCNQGYFSMHNRGAILLSQAFGMRDVVKACMSRKLQEVREKTFSCYEPAGSLGYPTNHYWSTVASVDLRGSWNATWKVPDGVVMNSREPGWGCASEMAVVYGL